MTIENILMANTSLDTISQPTENQTPSLSIQRIYTKDVSFESPHAPEAFKTTETPTLDLQIHIKTPLPSKDIYEVELHLTVKATIASTNTEAAKTLFCVEVKQAGIFEIQWLEPAQLAAVLNVTCPTILYPYASALIADLVSRSTFMPPHLAPINFEAIYAQHQVDATPTSYDA